MLYKESTRYGVEEETTMLSFIHRNSADEVFNVTRAAKKKIYIYNAVYEREGRDDYRVY